MRSQRRCRLTALLLAGLSLSASPAEAQIRTWANSTNGLWTNASQWLSADVPDGPTESAVFDRFGTYAVTLLDSDPSIVLDELRVDRGVVTLRADGVGDGVLRTGGDTIIAGELRLTETASTYVDLGVAGELRVLSGARLYADGGPLFALSTTLSGGSLTANTTIELNNGAFAELGTLTVADEGAVLSRAGLDLINGSTSMVDNLRIATQSLTGIGEVTIDASNFFQSFGTSTIVGRSRPEVPVGRGALTVTNNGTLTLGFLTINDTGRVVVNNSTVTVTGSIDIDGGWYEERGTIVRDFGLVDSITIRNNGIADFTTTPLVIGSGDQLQLGDSTLNANAGLLLDGGTLTVLPNTEALFTGDFRQMTGVLNLSAGARAVFADDYSGFGTTGSGTVEFRGTNSPGNSIGQSTFGGDLMWNANAEFVAELAGNTLGSFDTVTTTGTAELAGELVVELLDGSGFVPSEGDRFTLLTADALTGGFDTMVLPSLASGLVWRVEQTSRQLTMRVVSPGVAGDFNYDGLVDAADYTVWRDTAGSNGSLMAADANGDQIVNQADLAAWRSGYGATPAVAIPEPATLLITVAASAAGIGRRRSQVADSPVPS